MTEEKSEVTRRVPPKVRKSVSFSKDTKDNEKGSDVTRFLLTVCIFKKNKINNLII